MVAGYNPFTDYIPDLTTLQAAEEPSGPFYLARAIAKPKETYHEGTKGTKKNCEFWIAKTQKSGDSATGFRIKCGMTPIRAMNKLLFCDQSDLA